MQPVTNRSLVLLTSLAMLGFAANSVLCRMALDSTHIDAASFTAIRLAAAALVLWLLLRLRGGASLRVAGNWISAVALFVYAAAFSLAYRELSTGTGALLLFGAVQLTMMVIAFARGERLDALQATGYALAIGGVAFLLLPGVTAPALKEALMMLVAGMAWGIYTLRGQGSGDATATTAGNFMRTLPLAAAMMLMMHAGIRLDARGVALAIASGAIASGIGYALWYSVLPQLSATRSATVQLSVPLLAAAGGIALMAEPITPRLSIAALAILGGIGCVLRQRRSNGIGRHSRRRGPSRG